MPYMNEVVMSLNAGDMDLSELRNTYHVPAVSTNPCRMMTSVGGSISH